MKIEMKPTETEIKEQEITKDTRITAPDKARYLGD